MFCKFPFLFPSPYFHLVSVYLSAKDETTDSEIKLLGDSAVFRFLSWIHIVY